MQPVSPDTLFSIDSYEAFKSAAIRIFRFQAAHCRVYSEFISYLNIGPATISEINQIPFLPVEFFKSHQVTSVNSAPEIIFSSSGTTGLIQSRHLVADKQIYEKSFRKAFTTFYGGIKNYAVLALLPSYQEREGSSLIYMVDDLIKTSDQPQSGYFLYNHQELHQTLSELKQQGIPTILFGVTYALLDFIENHSIDFPRLIVMETGGMKGKRKEMIRQELHENLCKGFGVASIHSEYGMTELLSQAYSKNAGLFQSPPWMRISIRDINDPLTLINDGKTGGINVIDLANLYSCSFIATQDLGRLHPNNSFEILGRFDNSDIRGCNLLVQ